MSRLLDELLAAAVAAGRARLEAAEAVHGIACAVLKVEASPPTYTAAVSSLHELMASTFEATATPLVEQASADLAEVGDLQLPAMAKWSKGKARVEKLQADLAAAGTTLDQDFVTKHGRYLAVSYALGKAEVTRPLGWEVGWTIPDRDALHGLHNAGLFWVGQHYGQALDSATMLQEVEASLLAGGLGRREAGRRLAATIGQQIQRSDVYWEGLAATVATRARSFGALEGLRQCGAVRYEFVNPLDERTSDVCRRLDGTLFTVKGGLALRDQCLQAKDPEEWKAIAPWPRPKDLTTDGTAEGPLRKPGELQAAGVAWPPLHMHCRSSIAVRIWGAYGEDDADPLGNVQLEDVKPPTKKPKAKAIADVIPDPVAPPGWKPGELPYNYVDIHGWDQAESTAYLRLHGYSHAELAPGVGPPSLVLADVGKLQAWMVANPPAAPLPFCPDLCMPFGIWGPTAKAPLALWKGEITASQNGEAMQDAWDWLKAKGYSKKEAMFLLRWDHDKAKWASESVIKPDSLSPLRAAQLMRLHPPGSEAMTAVTQGKPPLPLYTQFPPGASVWSGEPPGAPLTPAPVTPPAAAPPAPPPPAPAAAPPTTTVSPPPPPAPPPPAPATTAAQVAPAPTPVAVHAGYAWQPSKPPTGVAGTKSAPTWKGWLVAQGYSQAEADALWPQLEAELPDEHKAWQGLGGGTKVKAKANIWGPKAVAFLEQRPPGGVVAMSPKPPVLLGPAELGARLRNVGGTPVPDLGEVHEDSVDGTRYLVRFHADEKQARQEVVANALYRRLGVEAPESRLVTIGGRTGVATREFTGWQQPAGADALAKEHGEHLAGEFAADAWLGNWNVTGSSGQKMWVRSGKTLAGTSSVLRVDQAGVMEFRATGGSKPFGAQVGELDSMLDPSRPAGQVFFRAGEDRSRLLPMMDRIGGLTDDQIREAVRLGGLAPAEEARLAGILVARREDLKGRAKALRIDLATEAKRRAEEAARRAAAAAARAAGKAGKRQVGVGLDLVAADEHLRTKGPLTTRGDSQGVQRHQVRATRARWIDGQKTTNAEGREVWARPKHGTTETRGFVVRTEVSAAHLDEASRRLQRQGGRQAEWRSWAAIDGTAADPELVLARPSENTFLGSCKTLRRGPVTIELVDDSGQQAMRGQLRITVETDDPKAAQVHLEKALRDLGMESALHPPSDDDDLVMRANAALWNRRGGSHRQITTAAAARAELQKEGIDPDRLVVEQLGREYSTVRNEGQGQELRKKHKLRFLYQQSNGRNVLALAGQGELGEQGDGFLSTVDRSEQGIVASGMSSSTDLGTGGAASVSTRLVGKGGTASSEWYQTHGVTTLISCDELDRADWYGYNSDEFGTTAGRTWEARLGASELCKNISARGSKRNEVMFRHQVEARSVLFFAVTTEAERTQQLAKFKKAGVRTLRGRPVEEFVVVMTNPTDFSRLRPDNPWHAYAMGQRDDLPETEW